MTMISGVVWDVEGVWETVKQGKRPRRPRMRVGNLRVRSLRTHTPAETPLESKSNQTEFFVREVKDKRMTKNGPEFLIGWFDFLLEKDDTWEPITNLTGSEHMICEFQKQHELDHGTKTAAVLKQNWITEPKLQLYLNRWLTGEKL
jgi:hypothetical protein